MGITEGPRHQKSLLSGWLNGQPSGLLMGLKGALEGLSGPRSGKHCHLRAPKGVRGPKSKPEEAAGMPQGFCKDAPRGSGPRLAVAKGSPGRFFSVNQES